MKHLRRNFKSLPDVIGKCFSPTGIRTAEDRVKISEEWFKADSSASLGMTEFDTIYSFAIGSLLPITCCLFPISYYLIF